MHSLTRTIVGACLAVAVIAPVSATANAAPAPAAKTAAKHFKVVKTFQKAKLGVCKVSVSNGAAWRVYGRLDTHKVRSSAKYTATMYTLLNGDFEKPYARWRSPMIKKGKYSKVGSVRVPNKPGYTFEAGIGTTNMGDGGRINLARVPKC